MTRSVQGYVAENTKFAFPFRMILAGSSGAGKTYFAGKLLGQKNLFEEEVKSVHYFYPCYLPEAPVKWHKTLNVPVSYHVGLPSKSDLITLERNSCVVIDDSFDEALKSSAIDHLFRVISGKRNISVIIMTQNNFSKGKYGREIRNSCNFSVLFRNCCDVSINENIARMAGMKKAYDSAYIDLQGQKYPYIFLDQSQKGQLSPYRLYTDIFDRFPICYSVDGMKAYIIGAQDFELFFNVFTEQNKFTANERSAKIEPEKVCETKTIKSASSDVEWGSDSEWESEPEYNRTTKTNDSERRESSAPNPKRSKQSDDERESIKRRFEQTLY